MSCRSIAAALAAGAVLLAVVAGAVLAPHLHAASGGAGKAVAPRRPSPAPTPRHRAPTPLPPVPPVPPRHRDPFGPAAVALAAGRPGLIVAAVYDVSTGQEWRLGNSRPQAEASVVKLDILETLLARYQAASATLPASYLPVAQQMMEYSDNAAATTLWFATGGPARIQSYNAAVGLQSTSVSQCVDCPGFPWPGWGLTTTTPEDQIGLLRQLISPGWLLASSQRRYALRLMENVTPAQRWGVSGGVPPGVTVALKNGWLPLTSSDDDWQVNSVGWIFGDGRDYLMAVLTTGNVTEQDGIGLIDDLAVMVWTNMS